jgi:hypothetical protein
MVSSIARFEPDNNRAGKLSSTCTREVQTSPLVREGAPYLKNRKCLKVISARREKNWSRVPVGGLIPG